MLVTVTTRRNPSTTDLNIELILVLSHRISSNFGSRTQTVQIDGWIRIQMEAG